MKPSEKAIPVKEVLNQAEESYAAGLAAGEKRLAEKDVQIEQLQIRIEQLESAARDYIDQCERFHKPA